MSNFSPKLEDATDEQLMRMINELDPNYVQLASNELSKRAIKKMHSEMTVLTWVIIGLTAATLFCSLVQIFNFW